MPIKNIEHGSLKPHVISRLISIFVKKRWTIDDREGGYVDCFNNFCEMLAMLDNDEQELILQLTEDFLHCSYFSYPSALEIALSQIDGKIIDQSSQVFLIPLIAPKDFGKAKSPAALLYSSLHLVIRRVIKLSEKNHLAYENPDLIKVKHPSRKHALVLLLDDFVGTGDTASEALDYYDRELRVDSDIPVVVALVAQTQGYNKIRDRGVEMVAAHIRDKGISDSKGFRNVTEALRIMSQIEEGLGVAEDYRLGYKGSEALVSMIRTPNNTFPVFWRNKKRNGASWPAPFSR